MLTKLQTIVNNMDLSQLNDKLQSVEKVIQLSQEKKQLLLMHLLYRAIFK